LLGLYLIEGINIGGIAFIEYSELILVFSEIGVVLLLFQAGLHMKFKDLLKSGVANFTIAIVGVILPFSLGLFTSIWLGYDLLVCLIIGGTLSATSIAISLKCLGEFNQLGSPEAKLIIGAAVINDVIALSISSLILSIIDDPVSIRFSSTIRSVVFTLILWFSLSALTSLLVPWFTEHMDKLEKLNPVN